MGITLLACQVITVCLLIVNNDIVVGVIVVVAIAKDNVSGIEIES